MLTRATKKLESTLSVQQTPETQWIWQKMLPDEPDSSALEGLQRDYRQSRMQTYLIAMIPGLKPETYSIIDKQMQLFIHV